MILAYVRSLPPGMTPRKVTERGLRVVVRLRRHHPVEGARRFI